VALSETELVEKRAERGLEGALVSVLGLQGHAQAVRAGGTQESF
jgi:hypothetical protein